LNWRRYKKTTEHEPPTFDNAARHLNRETTSISIAKLGPRSPENSLSKLPQRKRAISRLIQQWNVGKISGIHLMAIHCAAAAE